MRHRHGLRKLNRTMRASPSDAAQHVQLAAAARSDQDHGPQGQGTAPRRRAADHAAKEPTLANSRLAFDRTRDRDIVTKLFGELGPRYKARPGGYTRILKMGFRVGDNAPMAFVELVDRPEPVEVEAAEKAE